MKKIDFIANKNKFHSDFLFKTHTHIQIGYGKSFFHENNKKKFQINNKPPIESQLSVKVLDSGCRMVVTSFIIVDDVGTPEFTPLLDCFVDVDDSVGESLLSIDDVNGIVDLIL